MTTSILVWGSGAIGGTIGAHLVRSGHQVTFVDLLEDHVAQIANGHLAIEGPISTFEIGAPAFTPSTIQGRFDTIILAVKAQHTIAASEALKPHLSDEGFVLSAQNGLNEPKIAEVVGAKRTMGCFVNFGADWLEPGRIMYGGRGAVVVGEIDGKITDRARHIHTALQQFEPNALLTDNIYGYLWSKLAYGTMLYAEALTNHPIIEYFRDPALRPLNIAMVRQVLEIAVAEGIVPMPFQSFDPDAYLRNDPDAVNDSLERIIAGRLKSTKLYSGIWRDVVVRKRPTEVGEHLAPVIEAGRRHKLPTALLEQLAAAIKSVEQGEAQNCLELATGLLAKADAIEAQRTRAA